MHKIENRFQNALDYYYITPIDLISAYVLTLEYRRLNMDLTLLYKILINCPFLLVPIEPNVNANNPKNLTIV